MDNLNPEIEQDEHKSVCHMTISDASKKVLSFLLDESPKFRNLSAEEVDEAVRRFRYNMGKVGKYDPILVKNSIQYYATKTANEERRGDRRGDLFVRHLNDCLRALLLHTSEDGSGTLLADGLARGLTAVSQNAEGTDKLRMMIPLVGPLTKEQDVLLNELFPKGTEDKFSDRLA